MSNRSSIWFVTAVLAGVCVPLVAQGDTSLKANALQRTVEVRERKSQKVVETWERAAAKDGSSARVTATGAHGLTVSTKFTDGGKSASVSYKGGGHDGTIVIKGSKILQNSAKQPREMVADAKRAKARLASYAGGSAFDFKVKQIGKPPVKIDWDCELATIDVIIACGGYDIAGCGDAVRHQQCECLPEDPPGGCD
jgi:hypothetical protein